jgi:A/G-specific adenine glycosylase
MGRGSRRAEPESGSARELTPRRRAALRAALVAWYRAHRRDLPWRRTRDPYAIWISEAMLQQTRVETVIPYYERFLARFPDVAALATAELDDVTALWAGLGYYSRARNLHRAARQVMERHAGQLPDDVDALRELPGVGRYTAGALASIAFDKPAPIVDGNVARVLARLLALGGDVRSRETQDRLWREAEALARGDDPGATNQALMELGATVCTPRSPRCSACPWTRACAARAQGRAEELPKKSRASEPKRIEAVAAFLERGGRVLAVQRPQRGLLGGLWELPGGEIASGEPPELALARALHGGLGLGISNVRPLGQVEHAFTHRLLRLHVYRAGPREGRVRRTGWEAHRWIAVAALGALPVGGPTRKALALLDGHDPSRKPNRINQLGARVPARNRSPRRRASTAAISAATTCGDAPGSRRTCDRRAGLASGHPVPLGRGVRPAGMDVSSRA